MVVVEVGEEVQDIVTADRAAKPLTFASAPQRVQTGGLTVNMYYGGREGFVSIENMIQVTEWNKF